MKRTRKVLFPSIPRRLYCVCHFNWKETSSFVFWTYGVSDWDALTWGQSKLQYKPLFSKRTCWPLLEKHDKPGQGFWEHLSQPAWGISVVDMPTLPEQGTDQHRSLWNVWDSSAPFSISLDWKERELSYSKVSGRHKTHFWDPVKDTEQWKLILWTFM